MLRTNQPWWTPTANVGHLAWVEPGPLDASDETREELPPDVTKSDRRRAVRAYVWDESGDWCTAFEVDADCTEYRFYLLWITDLDSLAHVNEARAG